MNTNKSKKKKARRARRIVYSILAVLIIGIIFIYLISRPSGETSVLENGLGTIFTPIENAVSNLTGVVKSWFGLSSSSALEDRISELEAENELLKIQLNSYSETESENERLQVLLDAKEEYESLSPVYAKVIAKDTGIWFNTFTVNKGLNDGISSNMAVVNGDGLIGRVYEVGYNYSKVLSLIDTRSSVAALIGRTRDNGMLQGQSEAMSDNAECYMYYLANLGNVKVGDSVYTSGLDSLFPKGLYIGTVTAVSRSANTAEKYVIVNPAVSFGSIEDVYILRIQIETADETLPVVPTPTAKPVVTAAPTATTAIYSYETPKPINDSDIYYWPTATPDPNITPTPTPEPKPTHPVPEAAWLTD